MKSENGIVNGTKGADRTVRKVGTSRCPACGIRGRPSGPSLPRRYRDALASSCDVLYFGRVSAGFSRVWLRGVAPGCSLLRLVAATGKKLEKSCKVRTVLVLGNWCFNGAWILAFDASAFRAIFALFCSISVPQGSQAFHLVPSCSTYDTLKHDRTRYF